MTAKDTQKKPTPPPEPANVIDGLPDRSPRPAWWKYAILAALFAAWVGFLIYTAAAGAKGA